MAKYLVEVKAQIEDGDTGKMKNVTHRYLVNGAVSVSDAETEVERWMSKEGVRYDYEIVSSKKTNIDEIIEIKSSVV